MYYCRFKTSLKSTSKIEQSYTSKHIIIGATLILYSYRSNCENQNDQSYTYAHIIIKVRLINLTHICTSDRKTKTH